MCVCVSLPLFWVLREWWQKTEWCSQTALISILFRSFFASSFCFTISPRLNSSHAVLRFYSRHALATWILFVKRPILVASHTKRTVALNNAAFTAIVHSIRFLIVSFRGDFTQKKSAQQQKSREQAQKTTITETKWIKRRDILWQISPANDTCCVMFFLSIWNHLWPLCAFFPHLSSVVSTLALISTEPTV